MADWQSTIEALIRTTVVNDATLNGLIQVRCYVGELAGLPAKDFPLVTFMITSARGDLGEYSGTIRVWVWARLQERAKTRVIYEALETALSHQRLFNAVFAVVPVSNGDMNTVYVSEDQLYRTTGTFRFSGIRLS